MDDITFYFNTNRKYSKDIIGGLEIETCVNIDHLKTLVDEDNEDSDVDFDNADEWGVVPLDIDYNGIVPYMVTEDSSVVCDYGEKAVEFVTHEPYPIVDIMNRKERIGAATHYILSEVSKWCGWVGSKSSCGTHVHMSGPWTIENYPYFDKCMRYLWIQYFQPYFVTKFYAHQDRFKNTEYARLSDNKPIGKYEMFNVSPTNKRYDIYWHFEFRGYGEMIGRWDDEGHNRLEGHQYLKMLMNLWEATAKLHDKLKLNEMAMVKIERQDFFRPMYNGITSDKVWTKLFEVRKLMQLASPEYVGTDIRRKINLLIGTFKTKPDAIATFNKNALVHANVSYDTYRLRFGKNQEYEFNTPAPVPLKKQLGTYYTYIIHITWNPDLRLLMLDAVSGRWNINYKIDEILKNLSSIKLIWDMFGRDDKDEQNKYMYAFSRKKKMPHDEAKKYMYKYIVDAVADGLSEQINAAAREGNSRPVKKKFMDFLGSDDWKDANVETAMDIDKYNDRNMRIHVNYIGFFNKWNKVDEEPMSTVDAPIFKLNEGIKMLKF